MTQPTNLHPLLEPALASHSNWPLPLARPSVLSLLAEGPSHTSYVLGHGPNQLVLRINHPGDKLLKTPLEVEQHIHRLAAQQGITPDLLYLDPQHRWQLSSFINSTTPATDSYSSLAEKVKLLLDIHRLPAVDYRINLVVVITYYLSTLEKTTSSHFKRVNRYAQLIRQFVHQVSCIKDYCLCHNDLHPGNFIQSESGLRVIDWEYAGMNHPYFDLAGLVQGDNLDDEHQTTLLMLYQGQVSRQDQVMLQKFNAIYSYCCLLWYGVQSSLSIKETDQGEFDRLLEQLPGLIKKAQAE